MEAQAPSGEPPAARNRLLLALAALWLFDGVLQAQAALFGRGFAGMVAATAAGNPPAVARPVRAAARLIGSHPAALTTAIAVTEVLLGLGIAGRPTARLALAASAGWAAGVWWLGEGLGGLLTPAANPVTGAPGAAILYAVLAVVLWPSSPRRAAAAPAARPPPAAARAWAARAIAARARIARVLWLVTWGALTWSAARAALAGPRALSRDVSALAAGEPRWLAGADAAAARTLAWLGPRASVGLAVLLAVIAVGPFLPRAAARVTVCLAVAAAVAAWAVGQDFGGLFTGMATDPNSGPLLMLLAVAYWPARRRAAPARSAERAAPPPVPGSVSRRPRPAPGALTPAAAGGTKR